MRSCYWQFIFFNFHLLTSFSFNIGAASPGNTCLFISSIIARMILLRFAILAFSGEVKVKYALCCWLENKFVDPASYCDLFQAKWNPLHSLALAGQIHHMDILLENGLHIDLVDKVKVKTYSCMYSLLSCLQVVEVYLYVCIFTWRKWLLWFDEAGWFDCSSYSNYW